MTLAPVFILIPPRHTDATVEQAVEWNARVIDAPARPVRLIRKRRGVA